MRPYRNRAEIIRSVKCLKTRLRQIKKRGLSIGFVPTMGALHEGHFSLMRAARRETDKVIISIFVNPLQFGPQDDFQRYPRNTKKDIRLAKSCGVDIVFFPSVRLMYPEGGKTYVDMHALNRSGSGHALTASLCGRSRPGHFQGVMTVVAKLFNLVEPDIAYFGQKDFQQAVIIKKMVADLNMNLKIKVLPIIREADGLAMSSRNNYLSPRERQDALCLYHSLLEARRLIKSGECASGKIIQKMRRKITRVKSARIDYISIVNPETLEDVRRLKRGELVRRGGGKVLVVLAVYIGRTRLIDNMVV